MSAYTCITCRVAFVEPELQRAHYKTDWHRYNLKRKVAELPPVTAENFKQRVLNAQKTQGTDGSAESTATSCLSCGKHFSTENAYQNHIKSKKHKEIEAREAEKAKLEVQKRNEKNEEKGLEVLSESEKRLKKDAVNLALKQKMQQTEQGTSSRRTQQLDDEGMEEDDDSDVESVESWDGESLGQEECLFCSQISKSLEENVKHMTVKHSFFIPDAEFLTDLEGLITYLDEKVGVGHMCLWCNEKGKAFHTTKAAQQHMIDKGHCKLLFDGDSTYEYTDFYDYRSSYPDHETEGAGAVGGAAAEEDDMEVDGGVVEPEVLVSEGYELVLPSGATVGHRSLLRYYRQNVPQRDNSRSKAVLPKMLAQYKALGWTGSTGVAAQRRVKDLGCLQRLKTQHYTKLGMKANKLQKHFRDQNGLK